MTEAFELSQPLERSSWLETQLEPECLRHPGLSGVHQLSDGLDAFAARYLLMQKRSVHSISSITSGKTISLAVCCSALCWKLPDAG